MDTHVLEVNAKSIGPKQGISSNALKMIAIIAMLIDHCAAAFNIENMMLYSLMRFIGRITAPIMFYMIVEGYHHTRNVNKYTLRLGVFAIISYIPYIYFCSGALPNLDNFLVLNVIYTLFLGLCAIRARNEITNPVPKWTVFSVILILSIPGDRSYMAIIYILAFDYFRGDFKRQAFTYCMITLCSVFSGFSSIIENLIYFREPIDMSILLMNLSSLGKFIPILLLNLYKGNKGNGGFIVKWGFYIFYPLHLFIIGIVKSYL